MRYFDTGGRGRGNFAGVFVSHADSESALHLSEPPAHEAWNPKSERLRNADPDLPNLVEVIINAIKRGARNFQRELNAATLPTRVEGTRKLEQILADIMSSKRLRPQPSPDLGRDPFQIRIHERRFNADSRSKVTAKVEIKLRDDAPMKDAVVEVSISPAIVLDDNKRRDSSGRLGLAFLVVDGATVDVVPGSTIQIEIAKDKTVVLEAESEAFARDLYVDLELTVRMSESNLAQI